MSNTQNTSTLGSYIDSATGMVKSGIASVTGNTNDQLDADAHKQKAAAEHDASHTAARAGPFTLSSSGAPAKDNEDRTQGQWDQTMGSLKEAGGNLVGNEGLKQSGREQNAHGQEQEAKGQLSDLGKGVSDRVTGTLGGAVAGLIGDRAGQQKYADRHDEGKTRQRGVEMDLDKKASEIEQEQQQRRV